MSNQAERKAQKLEYRVDVEKEEKYLINKSGSEIGPTDATQCEMDLWSALQAALLREGEMRKRMVNQIRLLLQESAKWWSRGVPSLGMANDEKARFLWQFVPNWKQDEFDTEFAEIRRASQVYAEAALVQGTGPLTPGGGK